MENSGFGSLETSRNPNRRKHEGTGAVKCIQTQIRNSHTFWRIERPRGSPKKPTLLGRLEQAQGTGSENLLSKKGLGDFQKRTKA